MAFLQLFLVVGTTCLLALKAYLLRARHLRLCPSRIDPFHGQDQLLSSPNLSSLQHHHYYHHTQTTLLSHSPLSHPKDIKISVR